ncbi:TonB-dependent receptor domain-containing protein [Novosphingobium sp. BL-52-GroH]|uniref:TonB-dependent receptor domain-containing protein n=1 Tax=Novosphingobium sp. BL-52-GroH TaxID=3349877 RepID=UPI00384CEDF1
MAQRASDNAVTAAEDAFGTSIGNESIGLYSPSQVRGFSPTTAGNVRIEGLYVDRQATISQRLVSGSTIRVGLAAQGYLFPAPTGIADYRLRNFGERPLVSVVAGSFAYGAPTIEVDAQIPIDGARLGLAAGASYAHEEYYDGSDAHYSRFALIPRWRPRDGVEIIPFWSMTIGRDEQVAPTIIAGGPFVPPEAPRRAYFGQRWAAKDSYGVNAGVIGKLRFGSDWALAAGLFRSVSVNEQNFAEQFVDTAADGRTTERVIAEPGQRYASTSGEVRVSRSLVDGPGLHALNLSVRARRLESLYGGAAPALDLGERPLGIGVRVTRPSSFAFGAQTHERVTQTIIGLAYEGCWKGVGELGLGVQRADYAKQVDLPGGVAAPERRDRPWLFNAALAVHLHRDLAAYGSFTRGPEESGLAPTNAANRNEALPAIQTRQIDAGLRWSPTKRIRLVAGLFDVTKPYFNTDARNVFTELGTVRHRGAEFSLAASPTDALSVVAGALLMQPRVSGSGVASGRIGSRPLGQASSTLRANGEYRPPALPGFSIDVAVSHTGARPSSRDNHVWVDPYMLVDIGMRYRFKLGRSPATMRLQMANVTNAFAWNIVGSDSCGLMDKRRITAFLAVDL